MGKANFRNRSLKTEQPKKRQIKVTNQQGKFLSCTSEMVLYGGSAGGGKSYAQLIDALMCAINYPGSKQLVLRETFPELSRSLIMTAFEIFPADQMQYNSAEHKWYHSNGSIIEFGYLESDESVQIYQSAEYDIIRIDEGTHMSEYRITYMKSRIRGANNFPKQMKISTNPGGIGHKFLKKLFKIGIEAPGQEFKEYIGTDENGNQLYETRCFIPARVYDNEFLMKANPNYIKNLMQLPEKEKEMLLNGNWDTFDEQAFPEFDYKIHVCKSFPIPEHWRRWRSVDNGYDDPFAWYWFAVSEQGKVYIYREFTREKGDKATLLRYKEQAEKVTERSTYFDANGIEHEEKFAFTVAGHDAFASHVRDEPGKSLIDYYNDGGVYGLIKAVTDRRLRKATWHEYLAPYEGENGQMTAKLQIFDNCKVLIEKLPEMLKDPDDSEKVLDIDDHQYDSAGYGLIAYHATKSTGLKKAKTELEKYHDKLWRNAKRKNRKGVA